MIVRNVMIGLVLMTVSVSSGCSSMKSFFFGRGARCGLCTTLGNCGSRLNPFNRSTPTCGTPAYNAPPAYAPAPAYAPPPTYVPSPVVTAPPCAGNGYGPGIVDHSGSCNGWCPSAAPGGDCGCGDVRSGYAPSYHDSGYYDPYGSPGMIGSSGGFNEHVVSDEVIGQGVINGGIPNGAVLRGGDNFQGRGPYGSQSPGNADYMNDQYDSRGDRILNRQPVN